MNRRLVLTALPVLGLAAVASVWWGRTRELPIYPVDIPAGPNLAVTALSDTMLAERAITRLPLGEADFPTGAIVATDPAVQPERPAFARRVPPGRYPITVYKAQDRVALAEIRFAPGTPSHWQMALLPGQDARTLKEDEVFGFPVDAGLGALMDTAARDAFLRRDAEEQKRPRYGSSYDDIIHAPLEAAGGTEVMLKPLADDPATLAVFQSGWGDGVYASYWGLDAEDRPVLLVTDLSVIENGHGAPPKQPSPSGSPESTASGTDRP